MDNLDNLISLSVWTLNSKSRSNIRTVETIQSYVIVAGGAQLSFIININHRDINKLNILYSSHLKYILAVNTRKE